MKRLLAMFVLTPREQRLVIFVVLALVMAAVVKQRRDAHLNDPQTQATGTASSIAPAVSSLPNEQL